MKKELMKVVRINIAILTVLVGMSTIATAGNNKRAGQAGAPELLVNPWTRSSGMGESGSVLSTGLEAINLNVAGLADVNRLEINFSHRNWLANSGIDVNSVGLATHVGESGALGLSVMAMSFGDIENTTVELPQGGLGTYSPLFFNMALSYAKHFSERINGGVSFKVIHHEFSNVSGDGIAIDAGVNYTAGIDNEIKFGIALRNVGPSMKYKGAGLYDQTEIPGNSGGIYTVEQRSQRFELPSLLNIGVAYDFLFTKVNDSTNKRIRAMHRITTAGTFTSNSFSPDRFSFGAEYAFKEMFMARVGYIIYGAAGNNELGSTALTGLSAGASFEYPISKKENAGVAGLDFSWQQTDNFGGITSLGLRINM